MLCLLEKIKMSETLKNYFSTLKMEVMKLVLKNHVHVLESVCAHLTLFANATFRGRCFDFFLDINFWRKSPDFRRRLCRLFLFRRFARLTLYFQVGCRLCWTGFDSVFTLVFLSDVLDDQGMAFAVAAHVVLLAFFKLSIFLNSK